MAELRYNPLLDDWVMVAASRDKRPDMPKDWCPFCVGSGKVPDDFDVLEYDNDFPILSTNPPKEDNVGSDFYKTKPAYGKCEVILYSKNHTEKLWELSLSHIEKLVHLWIERFSVLSQDKGVAYVFPFENRGKEVGVTMPHPHGQIYAYSVTPLRMKIELEQAIKHFKNTKTSIYQTIIDEEKKFKDRILFENGSFFVCIPFFCEYPYGAYIIAKDDVQDFTEFTDKHISDFAYVLKVLTKSFDSLFDREFPYMMGIYNRPTKSSPYYTEDRYFRFHIKFFPPLRGKNSIKYNASSETAVFAYGNPRAVETCAEELREVCQKIIKENLK